MADFVPTHRHFKGNLYQLLHTGLHTETQEEMAVYISSDGRVWVRPKRSFCQWLPDLQCYRFTPLKDVDPSLLLFGQPSKG